MSLKFEDAQQKWAARRFSENDLSVKAGDTFRVEDKEFNAGGCETCSYEFMGLEIINNRTKESLDVQDLTFRDLVDQLVSAGEI